MATSDITLSCLDADVSVSAPPELLHVFLVELLKNAATATAVDPSSEADPNSTVVIIDRVDNHPRISITSISDKSAGDLDDLFTPYAKNPTSCIKPGLGLSVCHCLAERFSAEFSISETKLADDQYQFTATTVFGKKGQAAEESTEQPETIGKDTQQQVKDLSSGNNELPQSKAVTIADSNEDFSVAIIDDEEFVASALEKLLILCAGNHCKIKSSRLAGP